MAEERDDAQKTELPTQKRLQEAFEKGDVTQSPDISAWLVLIPPRTLMTNTAMSFSVLLRALFKFISSSLRDNLAPKNLLAECRFKRLTCQHHTQFSKMSIARQNRHA